LYDYAAYKQDDNSRQQFDLTPELKVRDVRVLLKGRLKFKRPVTWSSGLWRARTLNIQVRSAPPVCMYEAKPLFSIESRNSHTTHLSSTNPRGQRQLLAG
jgi:hypothetical protein